MVVEVGNQPVQTYIKPITKNIVSCSFRHVPMCLLCVPLLFNRFPSLSIPIENAVSPKTDFVGDLPEIYLATP